MICGGDERADESNAMAPGARPGALGIAPRRPRRDRDAGPVRARLQGDRQSDGRDLCRVRLLCDAAACDFGGPMRSRLQAQAALAGTGACFVCAGTLVSGSAWDGSCSRWRGRVRGALRRGRQLGARRRDGGAAARVHPAGLAGRHRPRRSPTGWPAGVSRRRPRSLAVGCSGRRRRATRFGGPPPPPAGRSPRGYARMSPTLLEGEAGPTAAELRQAIARSDAAVAACTGRSSRRRTVRPA